VNGKPPKKSAFDTTRNRRKSPDNKALKRDPTSASAVRRENFAAKTSRLGFCR
jgi:hypothetical protein